MIKVIKEFPNYTINSSGKVFNIKTKKYKKAWLGKNGYLYVDLYHNTKHKKKSIHRLLAASFLPNPINKPQVNHIDGNKLNNSLDNLEWVTPKENINHALKLGLNKHQKRKTSKKQAEKALQLVFKGYSLTYLAKKYNVGLTQFSYRVKEVAIKLNLFDEYKQELKRQEIIRKSKHPQRLSKHT